MQSHRLRWRSADGAYEPSGDREPRRAIYVLRGLVNIVA